LSLHISSYFLGHRIDESFFSIERFSSHILVVGAVVNLAHQFDSQQTVGSRSVEASPCCCRCLENQDISSLVAQSKWRGDYSKQPKKYVHPFGISRSALLDRIFVCQSSIVVQGG
jgi:hypothetical protein